MVALQYWGFDLPNSAMHPYIQILLVHCVEVVMFDTNTHDKTLCSTLYKEKAVYTLRLHDLQRHIIYSF